MRAPTWLGGRCSLSSLRIAIRGVWARVTVQGASVAARGVRPSRVAQTGVVRRRTGDARSQPMDGHSGRHSHRLRERLHAWMELDMVRESLYMGMTGGGESEGEWGRNVLLGSSPHAVTPTRRMAPTAPVTAAISPPTARRDTHLPCTVRPDDPTDRTSLLPCFPVCPFSPSPYYKPSDARSSRPLFHSRHGRLR